MSDPINPKHYKHLPAEAIEIIEAAIEGAPSPQAAAAQSHLLGYALRANQKGQLAIDAGKAEWYAARWLKAIREAEAKASVANETPDDEPSQPAPDLSQMGIEVVSDFDKPKRYREPTLEDLKNGAIECQYRDNDNEQWRTGFLAYILNGSMPFLCTDRMEQFSGQWAQCRIEAAE